jgi:transposase-like protein
MGMTDAEVVENLRHLARWQGDQEHKAACLRGAEAIEEVARLEAENAELRRENEELRRCAGV